MDIHIPNLLFLTITTLGLSSRFFFSMFLFTLGHKIGWVHLPGQLGVIAGTPFIIVFAILFVVSLIYGLTPFIGTAKYGLSTIINPILGFGFAYLATAEYGSQIQIISGCVVSLAMLIILLFLSKTPVSVIPGGKIVLAIVEHSFSIAFFIFIISYHAMVLVVGKFIMNAIVASVAVLVLLVAILGVMGKPKKRKRKRKWI